MIDQNSEFKGSKQNRSKNSIAELELGFFSVNYVFSPILHAKILKKVIFRPILVNVHE